MLRRIALFTVVCTLLFGTVASAECRPDQQNGSVMCNAACRYGNPPYCEIDMQLAWEDYCYFDWVVCTCHEGNSDPCCDSGGI